MLSSISLTLPIQPKKTIFCFRKETGYIGWLGKNLIDTFLDFQSLKGYRKAGKQMNRPFAKPG